MACGIAQTSLMASFDIDISDGILRPYLPHVGIVDCVVEFNTADLVI